MSTTKNDPETVHKPFVPEHVQMTEFTYRAVLLLASGLQMAGPVLTPVTFERGLHRTIYPDSSSRLKQADPETGGW